MSGRKQLSFTVRRLHLSQWSAGTAFVSLAMVSVAATHAFGHDLAAAGIRGRVTDASGAAVVGVAVTATSPALLVALSDYVASGGG